MRANRPVRTIVCAALLMCTTHLWAQAPAKTIRWIVPFPPGGITDVLARLISVRMQTGLGQPIVVENRPGAGGMIGAEIVAKGTPDGSLLFIGGTIVPTAPSLYRKLNFDPLHDLAPVAHVGYSANVLVVAAGHPAKNVKELVDMARSKPGRLNYASIGNGSLLQLAAEELNRDAGVNIVQVPYKGGAEMVAAVITGQVDLSFDNMVQVLPQIKAGKMRALAVTTRTRDRALPDVPTMIESGFKDFEISTWTGVWTTGGTPGETVSRLEGAMRKVLASPEFVAAIQKTGVTITNLGSRDLAKIVVEEAVRWDKVLKFAGVKPE